VVFFLVRPAWCSLWNESLVWSDQVVSMTAEFIMGVLIYFIATLLVPVVIS